MELITIYFDGGFNGTVYGSWEVTYNGFSKKVSRHKFHNVWKATNNTAEYMSLLSALKWLKSVKEKQNYRIEIYSDSMLVVQQILGNWRTKMAHLQSMRDQCRNLLKEFAGFAIEWRGRKHNVARFSH